MRKIVALALLLLSSRVQAQQMPNDSALVGRIKTNADSIINTRNVSGQIRTKATRIKFEADTILKNPNKVDTLKLVIKDTIYKTDTIYVTKPDTSKPDTIVVVPPRDTLPLVHPFPPPANGAAFAELPRKIVDVTLPPVTPDTIRLVSGQSFQAALDNAPPGALILLPRSSAFSGNFELAKNNCPKWTIIRTDIADSLLGPPGLRVNAKRAGVLTLAKLLALNNQGAIGTRPNASAGCYRLIGLEITEAAGAADANGLVRFGDNTSTTYAMQAHDLILDRSFVHGLPTVPVRRCVILNSANSAILDSELSNCNSLNGDSQSILSYNGAGPFLIRNNHIEGGSEVIMFGGSAPSIDGLVGCDVVIEDNNITRNPNDKAANVTVVKNLLESKNVCRLLAQRNRIFNNWAQGQTGFGILFKSTNQSGGSCTWCRSRDITIRSNRIWNIGSGFNLANIQEGPAQPAARYSIYNNYIDSMNVGIYTADGIPFQILGGVPDIVIMRNEMVGPGTWGLMQFDGGVPGSLMTVTNNIFWCGGYGMKGTGISSGNVTWQAYTTNGLWLLNALYGCGASGVYPPGSTYFPSNEAVIDIRYGPTPP